MTKQQDAEGRTGKRGGDEATEQGREQSGTTATPRPQDTDQAQRKQDKDLKTGEENPA